MMKIFDVGEIHPNTPHLFADLVELLLLTGYNGKKKIHSNDIEYLLINKILSPDEVDEEVEQEMRSGVSAANLARRDTQIEDVMTHLSYREKAFDDWYPFEINNDYLELREQMSAKNRLYRLLLACSRLRSFGRDGGVPQRWAKAFTRISKVAFHSLAPSKAITRIFDANSDDRRGYYGTDLRNALRILGRDLAVLDINYKICDSADPAGDGGFDLVSNFFFNDGATVNYSLLGQCGAQEREWPSKTLEAHSLKLRHYFQVQYDYPCVMMTPVCYRNSDGGWIDQSATNAVLLADRGRLLQLLDEEALITSAVSEVWFTEFEDQFSEYQPETNTMT